MSEKEMSEKDLKTKTETSLAKELKVEVEKEERSSRNKILVKKAFDKGLETSKAISEEIGMTVVGVEKYAKELKIELKGE